MNKRQWIKWTLCAAAVSWLGACATRPTGKPQSDLDLRNQGFVVEYELAAGASDKEGVEAYTDEGYRLFRTSILNGKNGGLSSFGGTVPFPRWVRVTWRKNTDQEKGLYWTTGTVVGDHRVEVLSRIPTEAFELSNSRTMTPLVIRFRVGDDGVQLSWQVRDQTSVPFKVLMHGGDFMAAEIYNGKVVRKGWYIHPVTGQKIEVDY